MSDSKSKNNIVPTNVLRQRPGMFAGAVHTKERAPDDSARDAAIATLSREMSDAKSLHEDAKKSYDNLAKDVKGLQEAAKSRGEVDGEIKSKLEETGEKLAEALATVQAMEQGLEAVRKELDQPFMVGGKDLQQKDRETAVELQRRIYLEKGDGPLEDFRPDMDNLVNPVDARSAAYKMMRAGVDTLSDIKRSFTTGEQKAFEAAGMDQGFFSPEILGIEVDCDLLCASMLDMYDQRRVTRSTFKFPHVISYGDLGGYTCDARCDAEFGPEGNIQWKNGQVYDYRGVFCLHKDTVRESSYDILGFMMRGAARSYAIKRNAAMISGDGVNEPLGWLTADAFAKIASPSANPTHQDLRQFLASHPREQDGRVTSIMHQNTFAYFASMVDANGRFLFGDGLMGFGPEDVRDNIRISNCLPDPTIGGTKGTAAAPFATGAFIMAAGVWDKAVTLVDYRPMFMEQHIGGSTAWCAKYQFGAKDGGFITCANAARVFQAG